MPETITMVGALAAAGALWRVLRALNAGEVLKILAWGKIAVTLERERRETLVALAAHVPPGAQLVVGAAPDGAPSVAYTSAGGGGQERGEGL